MMTLGEALHLRPDRDVISWRVNLSWRLGHPALLESQPLATLPPSSRSLPWQVGYGQGTLVSDLIHILAQHNVRSRSSMDYRGRNQGPVRAG